MRYKFCKYFASAFIVFVFSMANGNAFGKNYAVVYSFTGGVDGGTPAAGFVADKSANFYSTSLSGGGFGQGTVFKIAPDGTETVLYSFTGGGDGGEPQSTLIWDKSGNLYGTTIQGGANNLGTVFELTPDGTEAVLYSFKGGEYDGAFPQAGLIADAKGNLYGTTESGGSSVCGGGCGTVFEVAHNGAEQVLYEFGGSPDGAYPIAGLVADSSGTLFGTTLGGGIQSNFCGVGCGTVFKLAPHGKSHWKESLIYFFLGGGNDATNPGSNLIFDKAGNLYGTANLGGDYNVCFFGGCGAVFKLSPTQGIWTETLLHTFEGGSDGSSPYAGLIEDKSGNFYGATFEGGSGNKICNDLSSGCGVIFKLAPDGTETILHKFSGAPKDGESPQASLFADGKGNLYGTTVEGGASHNCFENMGCGTVFKIGK
jgi:uncharacterized repeat protein (TIGR03803 family)